MSVWSLCLSRSLTLLTKKNLNLNFFFYVNRCRHMREHRCSRFSYVVVLVSYVVGLVCEYLPEGAHIGENTDFIACVNSWLKNVRAIHKLNLRTTYISSPVSTKPTHNLNELNLRENTDFIACINSWLKNVRAIPKLNLRITYISSPVSTKPTHYLNKLNLRENTEFIACINSWLKNVRAIPKLSLRTT